METTQKLQRGEVSARSVARYLAKAQHEHIVGAIELIDDAPLHVIATASRNEAVRRARAQATAAAATLVRGEFDAATTLGEIIATLHPE